MKTIEDIIGNHSITEDNLDEYYDELFEYFLDSGEMPYGTAKARTGDPMEWIFNKLHDMGYIVE